MSGGRDTSTPISALYLLILGGLNVLGPLSVDTYLPALPTISRDLSATTSQTQITLSACILGMALGPIIAGPISDALGRRRPLLIGLAAYALVSLLCIGAPSVASLTLLRFVQGAAGVTGIVIALAIARDLYSGIALARCLSLLVTIQAIGPIVAPVLGSLLLTFTSWRGIFVVLAFVSAVLFLGAAFGLRETLPPGRRNDRGISASLSAFRELLINRRFVGYALSSGFVFTAGIVYISGSPFILQSLYGVSPQLLGFLFGINGLGIVITSQVSARLVGRATPQTLLTWGLAATALGGTAMLVVALSGIGVVGILLSFFVIAASIGFVLPNATALALANVQAAGSASALLGMVQLTIGAVAAPLVGLSGSTSAVPIATAIAVFGITALSTFIIFCRPAQSPAMVRGGEPVPQESAIDE